MSKPMELRALTGARGVAAWWVVLYHIRLSIAGLPAGALNVLSKGYLAVDFFFLLSGFVIWLTWHDRLRSGGDLAITTFLRRRAARIWPLHLAVLAAAVALALLLVATGRPDEHEYPFAQLPLQLLLMQNWGLTRALAWNEPAWSISTEFAAYLLFPLLMRVVDWRRSSGLTLLAAAALPLLALHHATGDAGLLSEAIPRTGLPRCLAEFTVGTIVAALWMRAPERSWAPPALLAAILAMLRAAGAPETLVTPALLAAVLMTLARGAGARGNPLEGLAIHYLGKISFATYLAHMLIWRFFKMAAVRDPAAVPPALILLYLAIVACASAALYEGLEKPAQVWVERLPARLAARRKVRAAA